MILTALHVAAECGHVELADLLVNQGAVVNALDYQHGFTPLHLAAQAGRQAIIVCLLLSGFSRSLVFWLCPYLLLSAD